MKRFYSIAGFGILAISLFSLFEKGKSQDVQSGGELVQTVIIDKSNVCSTNWNKYIKVEYLGKVYSIRVNGAYCESHQIGDTIKLRYMSGRLVLPEAELQKDIVLTTVFGVIGLGFIYMGLFHKKK